jgi:hypothetical protein
MYVTDVPVFDRLTDPEIEARDRRAREEHNAALQAHIGATRPTRRY